MIRAMIAQDTMDQYVAKLVLPASLERYLYLSHYRGSQTFIKTTTITLLYFANNIPWDGLPRTFKHAMSVTHRLGIRYL
jgi:hypothetical protein